MKEAPEYRGACELASHEFVPAFHATYACVFATRYYPQARKRTATEGDRKGKGQHWNSGGGKKGKGEGKQAAASSDWTSSETGEAGSSKRAGSYDVLHSQAKERKIEPEGSSSSSKGKGRGKNTQGKDTSGK